MRKIAAMSALSLIFLACGTEASPPSVESIDTVPAATSASSDPIGSTTLEVATDGTTAGHDDDETTHAEEEEMEHEDAVDQPDAAVDREITVIATEFAFEPSSFTVSMGETVRFVVHNEGVIEHEFRINTKHAAEEHIAAGHDDHDVAVEDETEHGHEEMLVLVPAGGTDMLTMTFAEDADFDVVSCLLPGHYEAGMLADLTIQ